MKAWPLSAALPLSPSRPIQSSRHHNGKVIENVTSRPYSIWYYLLWLLGGSHKASAGDGGWKDPLGRFVFVIFSLWASFTWCRCSMSSAQHAEEACRFWSQQLPLHCWSGCTTSWTIGKSGLAKPTLLIFHKQAGDTKKNKKEIWISKMALVSVILLRSSVVKPQYTYGIYHLYDFWVLQVLVFGIVHKTAQRANRICCFLTM